MHWGGRIPRHVVRDKWSAGVTLVVHHTVGVMPRNADEERAEMRNIQRIHMQHGWSDIGYNYIIMPSGRVYSGRGYNIVGAHTANHNTGTIGVAFAGNYDVRKLNFRQRRAFWLLKKRLRRDGARIDAICGHRQMPGQATACPGRHIMRQLKLAR